MRARRTVLGIVTALLFAVGVEARAESQQVVDKIVALNKAAIASLQKGDHDAAKTQLMDAVVLGKENGMGMHAAMARTYLHLGVLYTDGLKDKEKAQRNFGLALKVRPDIEITPALASAAVTGAFAEARGAAGLKAPEAKTAVAAAASPPAPAVDKKKEEAEAKERALKAEKEKERAAAEKEKADKALAQSREQEKKQQADKDRLHKDLTDKDKQLAEKDKQLAEKEKRLAEKDKQLAEKDKQLADISAREKKEREARERFEKLNQENGKLAEAGAREKKEREAREKLEKDHLQAETRDKERKAREAEAQATRARLVEGPELPASIPQPLFCPTRDEAVVGVEMHVHCVTQAQVKARSIVLFYRPSGSAHFNSTTMERSKKGWWTAAVPANRVLGKTLQYYVEARGEKDEVSAKHGKSDSPNLVMLKASADALSKKSASDPVAAAPAPKSKAKAATKAAGRTPAAQRQRTKPRR